MFDWLFQGYIEGKLIRLMVNSREKIRGGAAINFGKLNEGDKVRTNKDYLRYCGKVVPIEGVVVGKEVLQDQEELDEKCPYSYAGTNPYVLHVKTSEGEIKRLNVAWLTRAR